MHWLAHNKDALAAAASIASILGIITVIIGFWAFVCQQVEARRTRALKRTKLSLELMWRYYDDREFDDLRHNLWARTSPERSQPNKLSRTEIRLLNYFEALALAVDEKVLDARLVSRMLGRPLQQLAENPFFGTYIRNPTHSYEGIRDLWARLGIVTEKDIEKV